MHLRYNYLLITILVLSLFVGEEAGWCRTDDMKQLCVNCHTMHNSQGGLLVPTLSAVGTQAALLGNTCYGCHRGTNATGRMPFVLPDSGSANYGATGTEAGHDTLAGGSFFWVTQGSQDNMGHNVYGIESTPSASRVPPGGSKSFDNNSPLTALTCAGSNGCHGDQTVLSPIGSMYGAHHATDEALSVDGSTIGRSYRFLNGIKGLEDDDYEFTVDDADHNQYKGASRSSDIDDPDNSSISHLCAGCHGDFHFGAGDAGVGNPGFPSPWIRHPVDYDMNLLPAGTEYRDYGGAGNMYMVQTPLGSVTIPPTVPLSQVLQSAGDAIITCISCHRAHGSPYQSSLRWDYRSWPTGGYNGCGDCHTFND